MFRKKRNIFVADPPVTIMEVQRKSIPQIVDGVDLISVVEEEVDVTDPSSYPDLPSPDDYSFENLLASGVPLKEVPIGTLLTPTDLATVGSLVVSAVAEKQKNLEDKFVAASVLDNVQPTNIE